MTKGFFGGDPRMSHWSVGPRIDHKSYFGDPDQVVKRQKAKVENERRRAATKKFAGKTTWYFQWPNVDEKKKAAQKVSADALAKELEQELGFPFEVCEGCFL